MESFRMSGAAQAWLHVSGMATQCTGERPKLRYRTCLEGSAPDAGSRRSGALVVALYAAKAKLGDVVPRLGPPPSPTP